jgi:hypothetical protein
VRVVLRVIVELLTVMNRVVDRASVRLEYDRGGFPPILRPSSFGV